MPADKPGCCESLDICRIYMYTHARTHTQLEGSEELTPSYTLLQACGESLSNVDLQEQNTVALWHIY